MVEFIKGSLPWSNTRDRHQICQMKNNEKKIARGLPPPIYRMYIYLSDLHFHSDPDYDFLIAQLNQVLGAELAPRPPETEKPTVVNRFRYVHHSFTTDVERLRIL